MKPTLSVAVTCYNEAKNLPLVLERFKNAFDTAGITSHVELILVDNNSKDESAEVLKRELAKPEHAFARTVFQPTPGYGAAVRKGLEIGKGEYLCWTHADLQTDPNDVAKAYTLIQQQKDPKHCYVKGDRHGRPLFDQDRKSVV